MKRLKKDKGRFYNPNYLWYPMFTAEELHAILERIRQVNPGHPLLADPMLIGKN